MRFVLAALIALALPAPAAAGEFHLVGVHWQGSGDVSFRTRSVNGTWSAWRPAAPEPEDLPDGGSARAWRIGNPYWVGPSDRVQYTTRGDVRRVRVHRIASSRAAVPLRALSLAGSPPIVPRSAWGARPHRGAVEYADDVHFAVVHHTAGATSYTRAQSAAIVKAIQTYHQSGNGWKDVGYNFLVDRYGQVFEGRAGGVDRPVIGAHAEGFNTGSVGIAVLGSYGSSAPTAAARTAIAKLIAWRLDLAHVDPLSSLTWLSRGNARFPSGSPAFLRAVSGHRDTGFTSCPGTAFYRQLGAIAGSAAEVGLPKLYDPSVEGTLGAPIRFTARLSHPLGWTVVVRDEAGIVVASGAGTGPTVDFTWDATFAPPGAYAWTIDAGPTVRPATGVIGARPVALQISNVRASPATITPNGDSVADSTTIAYTLTQPAAVTITLADPVGTPLATLFRGQRNAGRQTFKFTATGVPDGRYTIAIAARAAGKEVKASVRVVIDRTLAAVAATPPAFSPNGDGRLDTIAFSFVLALQVPVQVEVVRASDLMGVAFSGTLPPGPQRVEWRRALRDGTYRVVVNATGPFGVRTQTARFAVDTVPPRVRVISVRDLRFSVSETVTLVVFADGRRIERVVRAGRVDLSHPLPVRRLRAFAQDLAGNRSRVLRAP